MTKPTRSYWQKRFEMLEQAQHNKSVSYYKDLEKAYIQTMQEMEKNIARWYQRFAKNNEISLEEAKRLLKSDELREFRWTVEEYIEYGKKNAINQQWMKQLENASSRVHLSRLESLQLQLQQHVEKLYGGQIEGFEQLIKETYQTQYYQTAFEVQKAFEIGFTLQALDETKLTKIISKPWTADGRTFSQKIWRDRNMLLDTLHTELIQSMARGEAPNRMISAITRKMNTSRSNAARLVMTESAFFSAAAQKDVYHELDVERYEIIATLDHKTSSICQSMDGKVFKQEDFEPGVTANPFHPHCRSTTAPYFEDDYSERIARDLDGQTYYVPSNMKYEEWYQTQVDKHGQGKIEKHKQMQRNLETDKNQYKKYTNILGQNVSKSFEEFQDIKYSNGSEWDKLQDNLYVKSNLQDGSFGAKINPEKQAPHIESTQLEGKSYFFDNVDVQKLFDDYAGTGFVERDHNDRRKNTEIVVTESIVGHAVSTNGIKPTKAIKIHHSKKRTHIVPIREDIL